MSGLTLSQAQQRWTASGTDALAARHMVITDGNGVVAELPLSELGVTVTPEAAADAAWQACHGGSFFENGWAFARSFFTPQDLVPVLNTDSVTMRGCIETLSREVNCTVVDGAYALEQDGADGPGLYLTRPRDGQMIDADALADALQNRLEAQCLDRVFCAYRQAEGKPLDVSAVYNALHGPVHNAKYDKATGAITPHHVGVSFDPDALAQQLESAQPGETFLSAAEVEFPAVSTEQLQEGLFRDVLGTYTTTVSGTSARRGNVRLAAACIDGRIYNPGEEFWYNATVGERTTARGFRGAPAYAGGKTVEAIGGGICQVSSTLYYATLLADLKIVLRYCHQFAPSYIPFGCDATVSWNGPDYAFRNSTDYPIKIVATDVDDVLTVTLYGTKADDNYVEIVSNTTSVTHYQTVYQNDDSLPAGEEQVVQTPYTGYFVKTYRNVYSGDGTLLRSTFESNSDYEVRNKIVAVGTGLGVTEQSN